MYARCRMSSAEADARKRKQPARGKVACLNCQETVSTANWKAVFQEAGGGLAIPRGRGSLVLELSSCIVTLLLLEESAGCATSAIRNHRFVGLAKASAYRKSNANLKSFNLQ